MVLAKELIMITLTLHFKTSVEKIHVTVLRVWNIYIPFLFPYVVNLIGRLIILYEIVTYARGIHYDIIGS